MAAFDSAFGAALASVGVADGGTGATATGIVGANGALTGYTINNAGSGFTLGTGLTITQTGGATPTTV